MNRISDAQRQMAVENICHTSIVAADQSLAGLVVEHDVVCQMGSFFDGGFDGCPTFETPQVALE